MLRMQTIGAPLNRYPHSNAVRLRPFGSYTRFYNSPSSYPTTLKKEVFFMKEGKEVIEKKAEENAFVSIFATNMYTYM